MISWMPTQGLRRVQIALQLGQPRPFGRYPLCQLQQEMITRRKNRSHAQSLWQYPRFGNTRIVWSGKRVATGTTHKTLQGAKCAQCVGMHGWNKFLNWEIAIWRLSRCQLLFTISQIGSWGHRPSCTISYTHDWDGRLHACLLVHFFFFTIKYYIPYRAAIPYPPSHLLLTSAQSHGRTAHHTQVLLGGLWCQDHTEHLGYTTVRLLEASEHVLRGLRSLLNPLYQAWRARCSSGDPSV